MKQRLLQLNLFLSEWKGRVPFTLCLSLSLLGGLTMPEWKGRVPLTRSHCERITTILRFPVFVHAMRSLGRISPLRMTMDIAVDGKPSNEADMFSNTPPCIRGRESGFDETANKGKIHAPSVVIFNTNYRDKTVCTNYL
ncbi:hypothetical protein EVAR_27289_1 [Eumeta japonica]|uniref:Uncharacterized protein n=1 Tax=Eumeta variegata TaxID=151549 RepID=A0A4C1UDP0_EUMVA|nr:hypothetical protein EVAR_27289_1 [Eumeta japonica]